MSTLYVICKLFFDHVVPVLCQLFEAHIHPRLRAFSILYLSIVLGLAYFVIIFFSYRRFKKLDWYKWIRMEMKLFDALVKDVEHVSDSGKKIDEKARQLWDSQLRPGATVQLNDTEREWVDAIKTMVRKAESWCETYQSLSQRRRFLRWFYSGLMDFRKLRGLRAEMDGVRDEIFDQLVKKLNLKTDFYKSLERSRSNVRSLQERPIVEQNSFTYNRAVPSTQSIEEKLKELIHGKPDLVRGRKEDIQYNIEFRVKLLLAFLEDLEGITMESETEKAWVKQVEEIIVELQHDMNGIIRKAKRISWLLYLGNWIARRKVKKMYDNYDRMLWFLIIHKDICNFKFIRRDPILKSVHRPPQKQTFSSESQDTITTDDDMGISTLLNNFHNLIQEQANNDKFTQLHKKLDEVCKLLMDAKAVEGIKHSRMAWNDQLKIIILDAEKSLKSSPSSELGENQNKTDSSSKSSKAEIERFNTALRILEIGTRIFRIKLRKERNMVVGMEEDVHEVVSGLITNIENCSTHFIVGMKGLGKTTLARMVYSHTAIQNHFKFTYWVPLPDRVDMDKNVLLKRLGKYVMRETNMGGNKDKEKRKDKKKRKEEEEPIKEKDYSFKEVNDFLNDKKFLIVLDNISSDETWETLKAAFPESTNGSRIVITTRCKDVVTSNAENSHKLRLRTKDESWNLFQQMVDLQYSSEPFDEPDPEGVSPVVETQKVKTLARKLVGRCGGLPLSILRLGYLMSGMKKVTSEELSRVLEHMDHNQTPWSEIEDLKEKDLPPHLRQCLSYFGLFPKDSETSARRLVALWVAEGVVEPQSGVEQEPLELLAKKYLEDLISRNLVQAVERKPNGRVKTCGFPSALRELWLRRYPNSSLDQRLPYYFDESDASSSHSHSSSKNLPNLLRSCRNPRSILFFDTREGDKPGEDIGHFLSMGIASGHLLQLQVLDLEHVFRPQLPKNIGKLIHLTYLGLRWTYLEQIPSSIGNLLKLQTLDVRHTCIRELPGSIWKLKKLRHLCMNQIYRSKIKHQPSGNSLQNLHTLRGAFVDKENPLMDGLCKLTNLRKLDLAFQLNLPQQNTLAESLLKLKHLQALKLKSIDEMGRPQDLKATFLSGLENLFNLYLFGKLENPPLSGLPKSLTDLTLSASRLSDDPMPELEKLDNLKCLSLYSGSYTGKSMSCSKEGFPKLHVLNIWMLQELEDWNVAEQAMRNLKQLEIRSCNNLKVPNGLRHLKTLGKLKLKHMPGEFITKIEETKEQIWGDVAISPTIITDEL
ncbi:probable disease resistance RPP8-like protein 2 [Fagus crenata]